MADCSDFDQPYPPCSDGEVTKRKQVNCNSPPFIKETTPSLPLAIALHFNSYFSVAYAFLVGRLVAFKLIHFRFNDGLQEALLLPVYSIWLVMEGIRIYLGQSGNLCEQVSKVAAFLLLSIFPQFLIVFYLAFFQEFVFPCDYAIGSLMLVILLLEIFFGCQALRSFIRRQTELFYSIHRQGEMSRLKTKEVDEKNQIFFSKNILPNEKIGFKDRRSETELKLQEEYYDANEAKL